MESPKHQDVENMPRMWTFVEVSTLIYGIMAFIGYTALRFQDRTSYEANWSLPTDPLGTVIIITLAATFILAFSYYLELTTQSFQDVKESLEGMIKPLGFISLIYLALISSIGEELLFRGALQPRIGIFATSLLFAFLHLNSSGKAGWYSVWAFTASILVGHIHETQGGQLLFPIAIHFLVNLVSLMLVKYTSTINSGTPESGANQNS